MKKKDKKAVIIGTSVVGTGATLSGLKGIKDDLTKADRIAISYGQWKPPKILRNLGASGGAGHVMQARTYKKLLESRGQKADLLSGMSMKDIARGWWNRGKYKGYVDAGYGPDYLFRKETKIKTPPIDYKPSSKATDIFPINVEKQKTVDSSAIKNVLKAKGIELQKNKKYVTLSAGGTGIGLPGKTQKILESLKDRKDAQLLVLSGGINESGLKELKNIEKKNKKVKIIGKLPNKDFKKVLSNSALNIGYGGSMSVTEQLGFKNPNILFTDASRLGHMGASKQNMEFAKKYYKIENFAADEIPKLRAHVNKVLDDPVKFQRTKDVGKFQKNLGTARKAFIDEIKNIKPKKGHLIRNIAKIIAGAGLVAGGVAYGKK
jgi:hypothetical protein